MNEPDNDGSIDLIPTLNEVHERRNEYNAKALSEIRSLTTQKKRLIRERKQMTPLNYNRYRAKAIKGEITEIDRKITSHWLDILADWITRFQDSLKDED